MKEIYETLKTPYSEVLDKECPWADYPRPSMVRDSYLSLNGQWDFCVGDDNFPIEYGENILVPFPPESLLSGIERRIENGKYLHYRRFVEIPEKMLGERIILHFGAADNATRVWVNGIFVGENTGGYLPFSFDITDKVSSAKAEICVRIFDSTDTAYPYGKQTEKRGGMWYTPVSGIWQTVWLESVPEDYIRSYSIIPSAESVTLRIAGGADAFRLMLDTGESFEFCNREFSFTPSDVHLWSPEDPYIYRFTLTSGSDSVRGYFAMRSVGIDKSGGTPRLTLNGKPYLFNGLLDQGYYPDGIFLPATADGYREDILLAKRLGFNMLRKHIKIEPEIFYYLADTLGIAVFQDMVNNSDYSFIFDTALPTIGLKRLSDKRRHADPVSRKIFREHSLEIIKRLENFPSVVYYTIFNEGWGQFLADENYRLMKAADQTRIYDATSGWFWQNESDVDSHHVYFKPIKLKGSTGRPIVISEFGGYSYRAEGHLFGSANYGYALCKSEAELTERLCSLYENEIIPALQTGVSALVYTQISDVEDETNGLITYDRRRVKVDEVRCRELMERLFSIFYKTASESEELRKK